MVFGYGACRSRCLGRVCLGIKQHALPWIHLLARAPVEPLQQQVHAVLLPFQTRLGTPQFFEQLHDQGLPAAESGVNTMYPKGTGLPLNVTVPDSSNWRGSGAQLQPIRVVRTTVKKTKRRRQGRGVIQAGLSGDPICRSTPARFSSATNRRTRSVFISTRSDWTGPD